MKIKAVLFLFILIVNNSFSQNDKGLNIDFTPPSPTPYELGKFGSNPISYNRGTVAIDIPIYELRLGDFSLPVSLSYNSSGIKVEDMASWVGLGWSLNAGGAISVLTKGKSDFIYDRVKIRTADQLLNKLLPSIDTLEFIKTNLLDSEPDIYNYNFCGFSGQFVIDGNFHVHTTKNNGGLVFTANKSNTSIEAKDPSGRVYKFNRNEVEFSSKKIQNYGYYFLTNTYLPSGPWMHISGDYDPIPTAFNLSEIVLENNGGRVIFEYENEFPQYLTKISGSISNKISSHFNPPNSCSQSTSSVWEEFSENAFSRAHISNNSKRLKKIELIRDGMTELIELNFVASTERDDLKGTNRLDRIELIINNQMLFDWRFHYDYFQSNITKVELITGNSLDKRLKLLKVQKRDSNGNVADKGFSFMYYGDTNSSYPGLTMPYRTSFDGYDHWGYCNSSSVSQIDADLPSRLFPQITNASFIHTDFICINKMPPPTLNCIGSFVASNSNIFEHFNHPRGNREPNEINMKAYTLERIFYPLGGHTSIDYEAHKAGYGYDIAGGLRIKRKAEYDGSTYSMIKIYDYGFGRLEEIPTYITPRFRRHFGIFDCSWLSNDFLAYSFDTISQPSQPSPFGFVYKTNSQNMIHSTNTDYISYLQVTESSLTDQGVLADKTIYTYYDPDGNASINYDFSFAYVYGENFPETKRSGTIKNQYRPVYPFSAGYTAPSYKRGLLKSIEFFNNDNIRVKIIQNFYKYKNEFIVYGNEVHREHPSEQYFYFMSAYKLYAGKAFMDSTSTTVFDINGDRPIVSSTKNHYHDFYELPTRTINYSDDIIMQEYKYPIDFIEFYQPNNVYKTMVDRYMINYPLEIVSSRNGRITGAFSFKYNSFNNSTIIKPEIQYNLELVEGITNFQTLTWNPSIAEFNRDSRYNASIKISNYDSYGRITAFEKNDLIKRTLIWSESLINKPVAIAENCGEEQIAFCGFDFDNVIHDQDYGNWKLIYGPVWMTTTVSKVGLRALTTLPLGGNGTIETLNVLPAGDYKITCWKKGGGISFPSGAIVHERAEGEWVFLEASFKLNQSQKASIHINSSTIVDELKLTPLDAKTLTYSFDKQGKLISFMDDNGFGVKYVYDSFNRLIRKYDIHGNILDTYDYNVAP